MFTLPKPIRLAFIAAVVILSIAATVAWLTPLDAQSDNRTMPKRASALTNSSVTINGGSGSLDMLTCLNPNAAISYVQTYNTVAAVVVGTTVPTQSYGIPINGSITIGPQLNAFYSSALKIAATTTATGGSAPGVALDCSLTIR